MLFQSYHDVYSLRWYSSDNPRKEDPLVTKEMLMVRIPVTWRKISGLIFGDAVAIAPPQA